MQTSYQVVKNALHFGTPDRVPVQFEILGLDDMFYVDWNKIGSGDRTQRTSYDEWGCLFERTEMKNMGQIKGHPLDDWSKLAGYKYLDPDNKKLYEGMERQFEGCGDKYIKTDIFMLLFERLQALRGFENVLTDFYLERDKISKLADRIVEIQVRMIENISSRFPRQIHGLGFTDDWGTELAPMISVEMFDEFFKPRYRKIFDAAHKAGWDLLMHSCGKINDLIPSLIEAGVTSLNMQQPTTNGIKEVGKKFAGKVCFVSLCDIQHTLPFKSDKEIEAEAVELMKYWGTDKGGFILADYGDGEAIGVPDSKKKVMLDAFMKHDRWKQ